MKESEPKFFPRRKWYIPRKTFVLIKTPPDKLKVLDDWVKARHQIDFAGVDLKRRDITLLNSTLLDQLPSSRATQKSKSKGLAFQDQISQSSS